MATMMLGAVYDAFLEAGASPEKSRQAAEAVASYGEPVGSVERDAVDRSSGMRDDFAKLRSDLDQRFNAIDVRFTKLESDNTLLKALVGVNTAALIAILVRTFFV
jgi:hypothetical protein